MLQSPRQAPVISDDIDSCNKENLEIPAKSGGESGACRAPLSSMQNEATSADTSPTNNSRVHLTIHPSTSLNAPAVVQPPPIVYEDQLCPVIATSACSTPSVSFIDDDAGDFQLESKTELDGGVRRALNYSGDASALVANEDSSLIEKDQPFTPHFRTRNLDARRIVLDAKFTPVTPEDSPIPSTLCKVNAKSYVAEDVGDLQKNIELNSLIIQKVEEMMTNKNKEYTDQLTLRDNTISALEKEVQKLKVATSSKTTCTTKSNAKTAMPPPNKKTVASKSNSTLNRTWSLRVPKKDKNEAIEKIHIRSKVPPVSSISTETKNSSLSTSMNKKSSHDSSKSSGYNTLPRTAKGERQRKCTVPASKTDIGKTSNRSTVTSKVDSKGDNKSCTLPRTKGDKSKSLASKTPIKKPCVSDKQKLDNKSDNSRSAGSPTNIVRQHSHDASIDGDSFQSKDSGMGVDPDFIAHLKRLTEEHDKLQVEYARLRVQMVEKGSCSSPTAEQPDEVPENERDLKVENQKLQNILTGYKQEVNRLQEELRRIQRKYWEQKLGTETIGSELQCASKQVIDLIDKVDDATCELAAEKKKCADILKQLGTYIKNNKILTASLNESQKNVSDLQKQMSEMTNAKQRLSTSIKDIENEGRETQDFLMAERNAATEVLKETENELQACQIELSQYQSSLSERNEQFLELTEKSDQKDLYIYMLQSELESTQNRARDMLLNQGAEITSASLALSELSRCVKTVMKSTISSNNLNEDTIKKMLKANGLDKKYTFSNEEKKHQEDEDFNNANTVQGNNNNSSIVASVLEAIHESSSQCNEIGSPIPNGNEDFETRQQVTRPIGFSSPFRSSTSLKPIMEEEPLPEKAKGGWNDDDLSETRSSTLSTLEDGTAGVNNQINSLNTLISKFAAVNAMIQDDLHRKIESLEGDKKLIKGKLSKESIENNAIRTELKRKISGLEVEIADRRRQENVILNSKNKLTSLCECHEKTIKNLNKDIQELRMRNSCIESENKEKRQQLASALDKVSRLVADSDQPYPGILYISVSEALAEKFNLKGEIARLQGQLSENEKLLEEMASKFTRNKSVLEDNWQKAEAEVQRLDEVIDSVINIFRQIPQAVKQSELLSQLWYDLAGNEDIYSNLQESVSNVTKTYENNVIPS